MIMKAIIYIRVSSDDQIDGTSLETQERYCRDYCNQKGYEVVGVYRHEAVSAYRANISRVVEIVDYCKRRKKDFNLLVVWKFDRLARSVEHHFMIRKKLEAYGISIESTTEHTEDTPSGRFMETIFAASAEYDNETRRIRAMNGMISRLSEGNWPWCPPLGYLREKHSGVRLAVCKPDPIVSPAIIEAFELKASGKFTNDMLAQRLNKKHLVSARGNVLRFSNQIISNMLRNKFYIGICTSSIDENIEHKGLHKPLVSESLWYACQSGQKKKVVKAINPEFILRGTLVCFECGERLVGAFSKGNGGKYGYYFCRHHHLGSFGHKKVHEEFAQLLEDIQPEQEAIDIYFELFKERLSEAYDLTQARIKSYKLQLSELELNKNRLVQMRMDEELTRDEFIAQKKQLETKKGELLENLSQISNKKEEWEKIAEYGKNYITNIREKWESLENEQKVVYHGSIFPTGAVYYRGFLSNQNTLEVIEAVNRVMGLHLQKCEPGWDRTIDTELKRLLLYH